MKSNLLSRLWFWRKRRPEQPEQPEQPEMNFGRWRPAILANIAQATDSAVSPKRRMPVRYWLGWVIAVALIYERILRALM